MILAAWNVFAFWSCNDLSNVKTVSWTGTTHTLADTLIFDQDTQFVKKSLYLGHQILISDTGCRLITRNGYNEPRQIYSIVVSDSLKDIIYYLAFDSTVISFKDPDFHERFTGKIYCGFNYLLSCDKKGSHHNIHYLPPNANDKLDQLNEIFESLLVTKFNRHQIQLDTLLLDSLIFEKVKGINPSPPIISTVQFHPPPYN